ncbi:hypothetical protein PENTCL1PPCAC_7769, partial [Pristionchus entomophagus]
KVIVDIGRKNAVESFNRRPIPESNFSNRDAILVIEGEQFPVNKQVLAAQSNYFNRLFNGGIKKSEQEQVEIKDTNPKWRTHFGI